jgi:hypothetical protein
MPLIFHLPPLPAAGRLKVRKVPLPVDACLLIFISLFQWWGYQNCFSEELAVV